MNEIRNRPELESQTTSLKELIVLIENAMGMRAKVDPREAQPGDVSTTYADITKARERLGYAPTVKIEEGIRRFVEWYKAKQ